MQETTFHTRQQRFLSPIPRVAPISFPSPRAYFLASPIEIVVMKLHNLNVVASEVQSSIYSATPSYISSFCSSSASLLFLLDVKNHAYGDIYLNRE